MEHIKIKTQRTGHVYTLGDDISNAKHVWFVFHGYGQLASNIIKKFDKHDLSSHFIIGIEGLSRFYWGGVTGDYVASWMTKGDREDEIADYLQYIDIVYDTLEIEKLVDAQFHCLGFSQGTATCWRWLAHRRPSLSTFVQWAGTFPPELPYAIELKEYIASFNHYFLYGDEDVFLTKERMAKLSEIIKSYQLNMKVIPFKGKHKIYRKVLAQVISEVESSGM